MKQTNFIKDFNFIEHMFLILVGPRRRGKSTLIKALLKGPLKKRFDPENIYIFCPSLELNSDYDEFKKVNKFVKPDPAIVSAIMEESKYVIKTYGRARMPNILLIFDDVSDDKIIQYHSSVLEILATRGRHFMISVIISSQRLRSISPVVRINSDYMVLFSPYNLAELEKFIEETVLRKDRPKLMEKIQEIYNTPYAFILMDNTEHLQKNKLKMVDNGKISIIDLNEIKNLPDNIENGSESSN